MARKILTPIESLGGDALFHKVVSELPDNQYFGLVAVEVDFDSNLKVKEIRVEGLIKYVLLGK